MVWWTLALAAVQGLSSAQGQKKNADAANKAQKRFERLNAQFANVDLMQSYVAISARRLQERDVLARSLEEVTLDATRRIGAVSVSAGESGLHGNTQAALVRDFKIAQLKSQTAIMDTEKYMQEQYARDVAAARTQRDSRILMGQQQRVQGPNYMQIFVDSATSYMQMQSQYNAANPKIDHGSGFNANPTNQPQGAGSYGPGYGGGSYGPPAPMY